MHQLTQPSEDMYKDMQALFSYEFAHSVAQNDKDLRYLLLGETRALLRNVYSPVGSRRISCQVPYKSDSGDTIAPYNLSSSMDSTCFGSSKLLINGCVYCIHSSGNTSIDIHQEIVTLKFIRTYRHGDLTPDERDYFLRLYGQIGNEPDSGPHRFTLIESNKYDADDADEPSELMLWSPETGYILATEPSAYSDWHLLRPCRFKVRTSLVSEASSKLHRVTWDYNAGVWVGKHLRNDTQQAPEASQNI